MKKYDKIIRLVNLKHELKYLLIIINVFLFQFHSTGQNIDSLKLALKNATHDTTRCSILNEMVEAESNEAVWTIYNAELKTIAEKNISKNGSLKKIFLKYLLNAVNNLGYLAQTNGKPDKALEFYRKSLSIAEEIGDKRGMGQSYHNIGAVYDDKGDMNIALDNFKKSLKNHEKCDNKVGMAYAFASMGFIYQRLGDIRNALEYLHKSLAIREELGDKAGTAYSYNAIAYVYNYQNAGERALEYFQKSFKIYEEMGDKNGMGLVLNNMGGAYDQQGNTHKAYECFEKSLKIREEIGDMKGISYCLSNLGTIYERQGDLVKALDNYNKGLKIRYETQDKAGIVNSLNNIANLQIRGGNTNEAFVFGKKGMDAAKELGFPALIQNSAATLKRIFRKQNKHKEAFEMYELEIKMRDSINNLETQKAAVKKQMQYDYEKKEAVAMAGHKSELEKQQAIANEKQRKQNIVIWSVVAGLILLMAFVAFVFKTLSVTRKQKLVIEIKSREVEEKQKEILDSIHYAKRIQQTLIPSEKYIRKNLNRLQNKG